MGALLSCLGTQRHPAENESAPCFLCKQTSDDKYHLHECFKQHKAEYDALPDSDLYTCKPCSRPLKMLACSALSEAQGICLKCWQQEVVWKEFLASPDNTARARAELKYGKNTVHYCFVCNKSLCHFHGKGAMDLKDVSSIPRNTTDLPVHLS